MSDRDCRYVARSRMSCRDASYIEHQYFKQPVDQSLRQRRFVVLRRLVRAPNFLAPRAAPPVCSPSQNPVVDRGGQTGEDSVCGVPISCRPGGASGPQRTAKAWEIRQEFVPPQSRRGEAQRTC